MRNVTRRRTLSERTPLKGEQGNSVVEAALEGAKLRLRPILMTSFAFILGCIPLMLAKGSGAASRGVMGTAVVFGMTIATFVGIFLIPVCYVFVQVLPLTQQDLQRAFLGEQSHLDFRFAERNRALEDLAHSQGLTPALADYRIYFGLSRAED
jgi:hypothetical protein